MNARSRLRAWSGSALARIAAVVLSVGLGPSVAHADVIPLGDVIILPAGPVSVLHVGPTGMGSLEINAGSVVDGIYPFPPPAGQPYQSVQIGGQLGGPVGVGDGAVRVTGAGSTLTTSGPATQPGIFVGASGTGKLEVLAGGTVIGNRLDAAVGTGGMGTLKIDGVGSMMSLQAVFNIGTAGTATSEITGGAVVNAQGAGIGTNTGSDGKLTVSGAGSQLNLVSGPMPPFNSRAFLNIGRADRGQLDILAGGKVTLDSAPVDTNVSAINVGGGLPSMGESLANANGTINVDGVDSELRMKQTNVVAIIGRQGTGLVNVTNGGKFIVESIADSSISRSVVGVEMGASGTVNVVGAGSEWRAGRELFIGSTLGGTGVVNVADGAILAAPTIMIRPTSTLTGGGGTVIGNVTSTGTVAPGNSTGIMNVLGNVSLAGTVLLELAGTALGAYDQLDAFDDPATSPVEGFMSLDGLVRVLLFGGFAPSAGSFFDVFTALDINLGAPVFDLPALAAGLGWETQIIDLPGREAFRLAVVASAVPLPGTLALVGLALGVLLPFARRGRDLQRAT